MLAGAFNPLTRAHVALAEAAREHVNEVICVVPRVYPHKEFHGAALEDRIAMLRQSGYRVETTAGGLFIDIARELRQDDTETVFVCGRDAAERIIHWDYGDPRAIEKMLDEFSLLVAERGGRYEAPAHLRHRVHALALDGRLQRCIVDRSAASHRGGRGLGAPGARGDHRSGAANLRGCLSGDVVLALFDVHFEQDQQTGDKEE